MTTTATSLMVLANGQAALTVPGITRTAPGPGLAHRVLREARGEWDHYVHVASAGAEGRGGGTACSKTQRACQGQM